MPDNSDGVMFKIKIIICEISVNGSTLLTTGLRPINSLL